MKKLYLHSSESIDNFLNVCFFYFIDKEKKNENKAQ